MSFVEQMAHIGSEVERALNWRAKQNEAFCQKALDRAFELVDLTLEKPGTYPRRRELARVREALADYFFGDNEYGSNEGLWKKYFLHFAFAARRNR